MYVLTTDDEIEFWNEMASTAEVLNLPNEWHRAYLEIDVLNGFADVIDFTEFPDDQVFSDECPF